ncbi:uncharacterized protein LOC126896668 [Daktulosphaira vitifoliae]|uniref:uncharacterized protein LOC126896668 n=1 Tax=Daktulosphaira vitifoliae TaxID=58002 RepID=UPI0021A98253|nr:uncharacterized protein LOC126896668 [Daktulosphaira vitifoliae]
MKVEKKLKKNSIDKFHSLNSNYVDKYTLLRLEALNNNNFSNIAESKRNIENKKVYGIHEEMKRLRLRLNKKKPKFKSPCKSCLPVVASKALLQTVENIKPSLHTDFSIIRFNNFVPGRIYKRSITIRNTGHRIVSFKIISSDNNSNDVFNFDYSPKGQLAPGMHTKLTVIFHCSSMEDVFQLLTIVEDGNYLTHLLIGAENQMPILRYVINSFDSIILRKKSSSIVKNLTNICVFECNSCLVGASKTIEISVCNLGRTSSFVCISEEFWYSNALEVPKPKDNCMKLKNFSIEPSVFSIKQKETKLLKVTFQPSSPSFHCVKFIIVADNSCAQEINVFGDGQLFDKNCILLTGLGLENITVNNMVKGIGRYILDIGEIGETTRCLYIRNTSGIKYPYRWVINHVVDRPWSKNAKVEFNVNPSTGTLDCFSEIKFTITCSVTSEIVNQQLVGKYHVILSLIIEHIPQVSLIYQDNMRNEDRESFIKYENVNVADLEVLCAYKGKEPICMEVYPRVVDLNSYKYKLGEGICVKETIIFKNKGTSPVNVSWLRYEEKNNQGNSYCDSTINFEVVPEFLVVYQQAKFDIRIDPKRTGHVRNVLKFNMTNRDSVDNIEVYVRGYIEPPGVIIEPTSLLLLENQSIGTLVTHNINLKSWMHDDRSINLNVYYFENNDRELHLVSHKSYFFELNPKVSNLESIIVMKENYETSVNTDASGISCELTEWTLGGCKTVYNQTIALVIAPNVRLNKQIVSIDQPLYKGIGYHLKGISLFNYSHSGQMYCWGTPLGPHANLVLCTPEPTNGVIQSHTCIEFELIITPKTNKSYNSFTIPCFIQNAIEPEKLMIEFWVKDFSAKISYIDIIGIQRIIHWCDQEKEWKTNKTIDNIDELENEAECITENYVMMSNNTMVYESENSFEAELEPEAPGLVKWCTHKLPGHDASMASIATKTSSIGKHQQLMKYPIAFKDVQCNVVNKQQLKICNTTDIFCQVYTSVKNFSLEALNNTKSTKSLENLKVQEFLKTSNSYCAVWIDISHSDLPSKKELTISVCTLATVWGQYEDEVLIELHLDDDVLPAVCIPIFILVVTYPIEFPLATPPGPTGNVNFSLYSMESNVQLAIRNKCDIPIQISWLLFNKDHKNMPFSVLLDMLTPNLSEPWSFRIAPYYGSNEPQYFKVDPKILSIKPRENKFVTFSLDRSKELLVKRNEKNITFGKAIGIVTSLNPPEKNCTRVDGFNMLPLTVDIRSETRHSLLPNFLIRDQNNIFQISAVEIYSHQKAHHKITRHIALLNILQYPSAIVFEIDAPFFIKSIRTLRCGTKPGDTEIRIFYEDLINIELEVVISIMNLNTPKMPIQGISRKLVLSSKLYAKCSESIYNPRVVTSFELHIHYPVLKLSVKNINFDKVAIRETKSIDVKLSSYSGTETFLAYSKCETFTILPTEGVVPFNRVANLTITFTPRDDIQYSSTIVILTRIPLDLISLDVSGTGIK